MAVAYLISSEGLTNLVPKLEMMAAASQASGSSDPQLHLFSRTATTGPDLYASIALSDALDGIRPNGRYHDLLGHQWVLSVFSGWEGHYRSAIGEELGLSNPIACTEMGDLRHLRNDIVHHHGIATSGESGKLQLLTHVKVGRRISVSALEVELITRAMNARLDEWTDLQPCTTIA